HPPPYRTEGGNGRVVWRDFDGSGHQHNVSGHHGSGEYDVYLSVAFRRCDWPFGILQRRLCHDTGLAPTACADTSRDRYISIPGPSVMDKRRNKRNTVQNRTTDLKWRLQRDQSTERYQHLVR